MIAVKGNVEYTIDDSEKAYYIKHGYDILNADGEKVADGEHKSISFETYKKLQVEKELVEAEKDELLAIKEQLVQKVSDLQEDLAKANTVPKNAEGLKKKVEELEAEKAELIKKLDELNKVTSDSTE